MIKRVLAFSILTALASSAVMADEVDDQVRSLISAGMTIEQVVAIYGEGIIVARYKTLKTAMGEMNQEGSGNGHANDQPPLP